jgi:hypothetical protein
MTWKNIEAVHLPFFKVFGRFQRIFLQKGSLAAGGNGAKPQWYQYEERIL